MRIAPLRVILTSVFLNSVNRRIASIFYLPGRKRRGTSPIFSPSGVYTVGERT
jgi:hypothetical protein